MFWWNCEQTRLEVTWKSHLGQPFVTKGAQMRLSSILSGYVLKTSSSGDSPTSLGILFQCSHCKNFFLIQKWTLSWCNLLLFSLSFPYGSLWRESLQSLPNHHWSVGQLCWSAHWTSCSMKRSDSFNVLIGPGNFHHFPNITWKRPRLCNLKKYKSCKKKLHKHIAKKGALLVSVIREHPPCISICFNLILTVIPSGKKFLRMCSVQNQNSKPWK